MKDRVETGPHFRRLTLATLASAFVLVTLGGVVRVTDSGLGCPDWPLCHGKLIPPADAATLIEYSHRLVASLVGLLVLATAVVAATRYRNRRWIFWPSLAGFALVIAQAFLGGITVLTELEGHLVMAHLALAEILMVVFILVALDAWRGVSFAGVKFSRVALLAGVTAVLAYALLLTGSYTTVSGASGACNQWPLCQGGKLFLALELPAIHMAHRFASVVVAIAAIATAVAAWKTRGSRPDVAGVSLLAIALFAAQVLAGAFLVWLGLSTEMRALHLALATAVWVAFVTLALLPYSPAPSEFRGRNNDALSMASLKAVAR